MNLKVGLVSTQKSSLKKTAKDNIIPCGIAGVMHLF